MKWQTVDEMRGSKKTDESTRRKNNIFRKSEPPQQNFEKQTGAKIR